MRFFVIRLSKSYKSSLFQDLPFYIQNQGCNQCSLYRFVPTLFVPQFASEINLALAKWFPAGSGVKVIAEPGTFYVASASTLAVAVIGKKVVKRKYSTENGENGFSSAFQCDSICDSIKPECNKDLNNYENLILRIVYFLQMRMSACIM